MRARARNILRITTPIAYRRAWALVNVGPLLTAATAATVAGAGSHSPSPLYTKMSARFRTDKSLNGANEQASRKLARFHNERARRRSMLPKMRAPPLPHIARFYLRRVQPAPPPVTTPFGGAQQQRRRWRSSACRRSLVGPGRERERARARARAARVCGGRKTAAAPMEAAARRARFE